MELVPSERIVAFGLLTRSDLELLGTNFSRAFPVDQTPCYGALLAAVDEADREIWRERDQTRPPALGICVGREDRRTD